MDLGPIVKALEPLVEPLIEQAINQLWDQVDAEIAKISQADVKFILAQLSPAMKAAVIGELKKFMS